MNGACAVRVKLEGAFDMLQTPENRRLTDGHIEGGFDDLDGWGTMADLPEIRQFRLYLGEPQSGPFVWLFNEGPKKAAAGQPLPKPHFVPPHLHRSATFRLVVGDQPRQVLFDNAWHTRGDYILLDANRIYSELTGVDGLKTLLVLSDRRGFAPVNKFTAGMTSDEMLALNTRRFGPFGEGLRCVHTSNDDSILGATITTREKLQHGGRAKGSIDDPSEWATLSDGSRVAAAFLGDPASGPALIMSRNTPRVIEAPAGWWGTDTFRLIVRGSCSIGGRTYRAGSFVASEAGTRQAQVIHGPEGSTQLLVVCDRRNCAPRDEAGVPSNSRRLQEIATVLASVMSAPARSN
jgi:hypothetical protein